MAREDTIAIVGMGGLFPGSATLEQFWTNLRDAVDVTSEVPPGRWPIEASQAFDTAIARADRVCSTRGGFVSVPKAAPDAFDESRPAGIFDRAVWERLDPVLSSRAGRSLRGVASVRTDEVDRTRAGVVFGNIVLPTETASSFSGEFFAAAFEEKLGLPAREPSSALPCNLLTAGLPAALVAGYLGLAGPAYTLDAACSSSLYALKLACDLLHAGRADLMLTGGVSRPDPYYTQMGFSQLRAPSRRAAGPRLLTIAPTDWLLAKGPACSCSNGLKMPCGMATEFMGSSRGSVWRTMSPESCSRRVPKDSFAQCARHTPRPAGALPTSS